MRRTSSGPAAFALVLTVLVAAARGDDGLADQIGKLVTPRIERGDAVGIVVGVVRAGRSDVFGFGRALAHVDRAPDGRTVFEIGSITKVFTSLALADMARERLLRVDDPIATLLPAGVHVPERGGRTITLRNLANHTSGLPRIIPKTIARMAASGDPYDQISADDLYDFLKSASLSSTPGEKFSYSNIGAGLLGVALARKAGKSYEELIVGRICRPLGMDDTRVTLDAAQVERLAWPYIKANEPAAYWHFDAVAGAGALCSTTDDMLVFARANLGRVAVPDRLRSAMLDMRIPTAEVGRGDEKIGLGWLIMPARKGPDLPETLVHNGGTGGFRSYLAIAPSVGIAVVVLSNTTAEVDTLGAAILKRLLDSRAPE
jgi:CubicO group peptidase (beta-lactamase class C family)